MILKRPYILTMASTAHGLLFGPRQSRKSVSVPPSYFVDLKQGRSRFVINYLHSRRQEVMGNEQLTQLTEAATELLLDQFFDRGQLQESIFELRPNQNGPNLSRSLINDSEMAAGERQWLLDMMVLNIAQYDLDYDTLVSCLWQADQVGPQAIWMLSQLNPHPSGSRPHAVQLLALLAIANHRDTGEPGPIYQQLRRQLAWMIVQKSEYLGRGLLNSLAIVDERSDIFAYTDLNLGHNDNLLHILDQDRFLCQSSPALEYQKAKRGIWRECTVGQPDPDKIFKRCPDCQAQEQSLITPAIDDPEPSLLGWNHYNRALATAEELIQRSLDRYWRQPLPQREGLIKQLNDELEFIGKTIYNQIITPQGQAVGQTIADWLMKGQSSGQIKQLLSPAWGLNSSLTESGLSQLSLPSAEVITEWLEPHFTPSRRDMMISGYDEMSRVHIIKTRDKLTKQLNSYLIS